jgi:hypothetical protein
MMPTDEAHPTVATLEAQALMTRYDELTISTLFWS